jgi:drug/metabolite transporter (DMT)-like permease
LLSILYGLTSAISWGAADFSSGIAARKTNVLGVVIVAQGLGLLVITIVALALRESLPARESSLWGAAAGLCYGFCLPLFYGVLSRGRMSVAAPVSAVTAALLPAAAGTILEGFPGWLTFAGILLAILSVWLIARGEDPQAGKAIRLNNLFLPALAGVVFGLYFISMHQASREALFWPIAISRLVSITLVLCYALASRQPWRPSRSDLPLVALSGMLDAGGNLFYILSGHAGRLDTAAVLGCLYPGSTVLLAALILKERLNRPQKVGILVALSAILLMTI